MSKDPDYSYLNDNGKKVSGSASTLHEIYTVQGGVKNYNNNVGTEYITRFVQENSDIINEGLEKKARRNKMKIVDK